MNTPEELRAEQLRAEARQLREHAAEVEETNPTAADYHTFRARWCEQLARSEEWAGHFRRTEGGAS